MLKLYVGSDVSIVLSNLRTEEGEYANNAVVTASVYVANLDGSVGAAIAEDIPLVYDGALTGRYVGTLEDAAAASLQEGQYYYVQVLAVRGEDKLLVRCKALAVYYCGVTC